MDLITREKHRTTNISRKIIVTSPILRRFAQQQHTRTTPLGQMAGYDVDEDGATVLLSSLFCLSHSSVMEFQRRVVSMALYSMLVA